MWPIPVILAAGRAATLPAAGGRRPPTPCSRGWPRGLSGGHDWPDRGGDRRCDAVAGYDGPTGLGTPNGIAAF